MTAGLYPDIPSFEPSAPPFFPERSAPPLPDEDQALHIQWEKLPESVAPSFFESSKIRRIAGLVFEGLSLITGGAAAYVGLALTAAPLVIVGGCVALSVFTVAFAVIGISLHLMQPSKNDPEFCLAERVKAKEDLMAHRELGFAEIRAKYEKKIVGDSDINHLVHLDIQTLSYGDFIRKHGRGILPILNPSNKEELKKSFLHDCYLGKSWLEAKELPDYSFFQVKEEELCFKIADREASRLMSSHGDYASFVARNGVHAMAWVSEPKAKAYLTETFCNHILILGMGLERLEKDHSEELLALDSNSKNGLISEIIVREVRSFVEGSIDYPSLRARNGWSMIEKIYKSESAPTSLKEDLKSRFLNLSYRELKNPAYQKDRDTFKISPDEIKATLKTRWEKLPLKELLAERGFLESLKNEFHPSEWKEKALLETSHLTVKEIALQYPEALQSMILEPLDGLPGEPTLQRRLQREIQNIQIFEELVYSFPLVLFEKGFFTQDDLLISTLAKNFVLQHSSDFITKTAMSENQARLLIETFELLPSPVLHSLELAKRNYANEKAALETRLNQLERLLKAELELLGKKKDSSAESIKQRFDLPSKQTALRNANEWQRSASDKRDSLFKETEKLQSRQGALAQEMAQISSSLQGHAARYQSFVQANVENQCRFYRDRIHLLKQEVHQRNVGIEQDPHLIRWKQSIETLTFQSKHLESEQTKRIKLDQITVEYETLLKVVTSAQFKAKKDFLEKIIRSAEQPVVGFGNALTALEESAAIEHKKRELAALVEQENRREELYREIEALSWNRPRDLASIQHELHECNECLLNATFQFNQAFGTAKAAYGIPLLEAELGQLQRQLEALRPSETEIEYLKREIPRLERNLAESEKEVGLIQQQLPALVIQSFTAQNEASRADTAVRQAEAYLKRAEKDQQEALRVIENQFADQMKLIRQTNEQAVLQEKEQHARAVNRIEQDFLSST